MKELTRAEVERIIRETVPRVRLKSVLASLVAAIGFKDGKLDGEPAAVGTTRFGGCPDLPPDSLWPAAVRRPLAFLGQVNLTEVRPYNHADGLLPGRGLLAFFFDIERQPWGLRPSDRRHSAVRYFEEPAALRRRDFPANISPENRLMHCRRVRPYTRWMLGMPDGFERQRLGLPAETSLTNPWQQTLDAMDDLLTAPSIPVGTHQLLGWADGLYDRPYHRFICAAVSDGFNFGRGNPNKNAACRKWEADAVRWRCLLQIRSDDPLYGSSWGDGGTLAFFIRDGDLRARRWERTWCLLGSS